MAPSSNFPSRYNASMLWQEEQDFIAQRLLHQIIPANYIQGSAIKVKANHEHFLRAMSYLEDFKFPRTMEEFHQNFRWREWDIVGERMLLAMRVRKLEGNDFQNFLVCLYLYEHGAWACDDCGLNVGVWCGEYSLFPSKCVCL